MQIDYENTFRSALENGINLFMGAGFSVLARSADGRYLPLGAQLAADVVERFRLPGLAHLSLAQVATVLESTRRDEFRQFIVQRFTVQDFDQRYNVLDMLNVKTLFTTNVDDLLFKIYESSKRHYLNNLDLSGPAHSDKMAIDMVALHGSVLNPAKDMLFGVLDLAAAFHADPDRWHFLTGCIQRFPTLFWGYGMGDAGTLEALNPRSVQGRHHQDKWILLQPNTEEGTHTYFKALGFHLILGSTEELLDYLVDFANAISAAAGGPFVPAKRDLLAPHMLPSLPVPVRPIIHFYLGSAPSWSDIFSGQLHRTTHFSTIVDSVKSGKHTIVIGLPACGKTTLLMQVASEIAFHGYKLIFDSPTLEKARLIAKQLDGDPGLVFIDNFTDSVDSFTLLCQQSNVRLVAFDRDYNFEIVSHKIDRRSCSIFDITELSPMDIQSILNSIPEGIRSPYVREVRTAAGLSPSLYEVIVCNVTERSLSRRFQQVVQQLGNQNEDLLNLLVVCCYVHNCRTPVSMDMLLSFFGDKLKHWSDVYELCTQLGTMVADYMGPLADTDQDHWVPRSTIIAEAVLGQAPPSALKRVLWRFHREVSPVRICRFDVFRRRAYDHELISKAFPDWQEGMEFYTLICSRDYSPYLRQHAALYLADMRKYTEAFRWIEMAITISEGRIPSIRHSHAIILFKANIDLQDTDGTVADTLRQSMEILSDCYHYDKRQPYHAVTFAEQAIRYSRKYVAGPGMEYLSTARNWLEEEQVRSPWHKKVRFLLKQVNRRITELG